MYRNTVFSVHVAAICIVISGCAGIPDAYTPPKPKQCKVHIVVDGKYQGCMNHEQFQRWRQRNGL